MFQEPQGSPAELQQVPAQDLFHHHEVSQQKQMLHRRRVDTGKQMALEGLLPARDCLILTLH